MSLYGMFQRKGPSGFGYNSTAEDVTAGADLMGRTYLVTGVNSGLGAETLRVLVMRGARVLAAARTVAKAQAACDAAGGDAVPVACELSEPSSVRAAVATVQALGHPLDGVIANAGIMALPKVQRQHGYEMQFFTNHVGHFMLVTGVLPQLAEEGRVVILSSSAHTMTYPEGVRLDDLAAERGYAPWKAYGQAKLANMLFAKHLATRLPKPGQRSTSVHPGVIATGLARHMNKGVQLLFNGLGPVFALKTVPQGAATQCYAAVHPDAAAHNGEYFANCNPKTPSAHGQDAALAAALWDKTEEIVAGLD